jgi:hypothetical protein
METAQSGEETVAGEVFVEFRGDNRIGNRSVQIPKTQTAQITPARLVR